MDSSQIPTIRVVGADAQTIEHCRGWFEPAGCSDLKDVKTANGESPERSLASGSTESPAVRSLMLKFDNGGLEIQLESGKKVFVDEPMNELVQSSGLARHLIVFIDLMAEAFDIRSDVTFHNLHDPVADTDDFLVEFQAQGTVDELVKREWSFHDKALSRLPVEVHRRFILNYRPA